MTPPKDRNDSLILATHDMDAFNRLRMESSLTAPFESTSPSQINRTKFRGPKPTKNPIKWWRYIEGSKNGPNNYLFGYLPYLFLLGLISGMQNGMLPSCASYALLPYGNSTYVAATTIANCVNPLVRTLSLSPPAQNKVKRALSCVALVKRWHFSRHIILNSL